MPGRIVVGIGHGTFTPPTFGGGGGGGGGGSDPSLSAPESLTVRVRRTTDVRLTWRRPGGATAGTGWIVQRSTDGATWADLALTPSPYTLNSYYSARWNASGTATYFEATDTTPPVGSDVYYRVLETSAVGRGAAGAAVRSYVPADNQTPALPRRTVDVTYSLPVGGTTWTPTTGAALQSALDSAQPGDVIQLQAGVTYAAPSDFFYLRAKANPLNKWIYVVTDQLANLPAEGERVGLADAAYMPIVQGSAGNSGAFKCDPNASYYRLVGLKMTPKPSAPGTVVTGGVVRLGEPGDADLCHHLIVDRCIVQGRLPDGPGSGGTQRGIMVNGRDIAVVGSRIYDIALAGECHGIGGWNCDGPLLFENNHIESSSLMFLLGGEAPAVEGRIAQDVTFRRNYCTKPLAWMSTDYSCKNLFEVKAVQRCLVEANVFDRSWPTGQLFAVALKTSPDNNFYWAMTSDVTFRLNVVKNACGGLSLLGFDQSLGGATYAPLTQSETTRRLLVENCVWENVGDATQTGFGTSNGHFVQISGKCDFVTIRHCTRFSGSMSGDASMLFFTGDTMEGLRVENNVLPYYKFGAFEDGGDSIPVSSPRMGANTLNAYVPTGLSFVGNVIEHHEADPSFNPADWPAGNAFPANIAAIGFAGSGYGLNQATSPYRVAGASYVGTDGTDPGVDDAALQAAIAGVVD